MTFYHRHEMVELKAVKKNIYSAAEEMILVFSYAGLDRYMPTPPRSTRGSVFSSSLYSGGGFDCI